MTTSVVTGGNGYFGRVLVQHLLEQGDEVRLLDIDVSDAPTHGVEIIQGDVRDLDIVRRAIDGADTVFHNVAQVPLVKDQFLLRSVNVEGTENVLTASRDVGVAKVVHTSSSAVFGVPETNPVLPTTVPQPAEPYGHAKLAAEWACLRAASAGLDVTIVRPRTILGHGRLGIFGILFDWIADGADPFVLGDGSNRYQFVHADDLAGVCRLAAAKPGPAVFNVGTDRFGTMPRDTRERLPPRRYRRPCPQPARRSNRGRHARQRGTGPHALRAVPLADVRPLDVVRHRARPSRAGVDPAVVDRRDVRRELRLLRGQSRHIHRGLVTAPAQSQGRRPRRAETPDPSAPMKAVHSRRLRPRTPSSSGSLALVRPTGHELRS